ncbi:conserved hypothetical protein [Trichinella spiralis]|uniref:hypothetical protein n=1 Tax=Trichinella spiralis TaxID=6334 RepID=UPI0001EFB5FC|nr:conserved hypothetical protein [Trichinella spiralis]
MMLQLMCNEPLSREDSFATPTGLLLQSSPGESTDKFLPAVISSVWLPSPLMPFLPGSCFLGNIFAFTRHNQQQQHDRSHSTTQPTYHRNPLSIFKYMYTYGSFIVLPFRRMDKCSWWISPRRLH